MSNVESPLEPSAITSQAEASPPVVAPQANGASWFARVVSRIALPPIFVRWWATGAITTLVIGLLWWAVAAWRTQSQMGELTLKHVGEEPAYLTLTHTKTQETLDWTYPQRVTKPIPLPAGDYEARITQPHLLNAPANLYVEPGASTRAIVNSLDSPLWSSTALGFREAIETSNGQLLVLQYDKDHVSLIDPSSNTQLWRQPCQLGKNGLVVGHPIHPKWSMTFDIPIPNDLLRPKNGLSTPDLDGDGIHDLILAHYKKPELFALSGASGKTLWRGQYSDAFKSIANQLTPSAICPASDLNGDGSLDYLVTFVTLSPNDPTADGVITWLLGAIDGTTGHLLWKFQSNLNTNMSKLPNTLGELHPEEGEPSFFRPLLVSKNQETLVLWTGFQQMHTLNATSGLEKQKPIVFTQPLTRPPQLVRSIKDQNQASHILLGFNKAEPRATQFELWSLDSLTPVWSTSGPSSCLRDPIYVKSGQFMYWPLVADLDGDSLDEIVLPTDSQTLESALVPAMLSHPTKFFSNIFKSGNSVLIKQNQRFRHYGRNPPSLKPAHRKQIALL